MRDLYFNLKINIWQVRPIDILNMELKELILLTIQFSFLNSESRHNVALYKHMAAFVMAYSFTEQKSSNEDDEDDDDDDDDDDDPAPAMVPMADILNHISNNNAHLEFGAETLTMVATQDIHKVRSWLSASLYSGTMI